MSAPAVRPPRIGVKEESWQRTVIDLARLCGWRVAHFRPARTAKGWRTPVEADGAGFPDLVLVRPPKLIVAELKSDTGRVSKHQERWLADFKAIATAILDSPEVPNGSIQAFLWRPRDWDEVVEALRR